MDIRSTIEKICTLGIAGTAKMAAVKWKKMEFGSGMISAPARREIMEKILSRAYKRIIIFENHFGYYNIMMQRPQHLLRNCGDDETLVLYNSYYDVDFKNRGRITRIDHSVYVLDLYYYRRCLMKLAEGIPHRYLCVYSTDTVPVSRINEYLGAGFRVIYEYVDDINPELISRKRIDEIMDRHMCLLGDSRVLTVTTADKLYQNVRDAEPRSEQILISNGAECRKFSPEAVTDDTEYLGWLRDDRIKVGYYGALASWVDYRLLEKLADEEQMQIILIGVEHDDSLRKSGLLERKNVRYFGKKSYDILAGYVHYFDVCMIPFVLNEITESTSPVKLFEYMAMEKPVVSTALPECMKYEPVVIAHSHEEFVRAVYACWRERGDLKRKEQLSRCAWENDWSAKADMLKRYLSQWEKNER